MVDAVGTTAYTYTSFGALASEDGPWASDTVTYSYTNQLRSGLSLLQPNASAWAESFGYDAANRLASLTAPDGAYGYQYSGAGGLVQKLSLPDSAYITNAFDSVSRLLSTLLKNSGNSVLNSHLYGYNAAGQRTALTNTAGNYVAFSYDPASQLKAALGYESNGIVRLHEQQGYAYDAAYNLKYRTNNALVQTFTVNNLNQLWTNTRSGTWTVGGCTFSACGTPLGSDLFSKHCVASVDSF